MRIKKSWQPPAAQWTAAQIVALRRRLDLSQVKLARKIGATVQTVSNWERGAARPGHHYTKALEEVNKDTGTARRTK